MIFKPLEMLKSHILYTYTHTHTHTQVRFAEQNESGRSLTEMMGTLAIMGILALTGIWMYNSAMDKLKANTIINEAQKRAVVVAGQIGFQGRTDPNLGEFSDNTFAGGTFSTDVVTSGLYEQFGIQVSNVPKNVCQNILNSIGATTPIRRLTTPGNPTTALTSCTDTNTFLMIYNNDMSSGGNDTTYATTDCSCQTVCGVCVVENGDTKCVNECPAGNTCSSNADCSGDCVGCVIPSGQSSGTCQSCQRVEYLESTGTQYIDTGVNADNNLGFKTKYAITKIQNQQRWGAILNKGSSYIRHHFNYDGNNVSYMLREAGYATTTANTAVHELSFDAPSQKLTYDGKVISATGGVFNTTLNYWLFRRNSNDNTLKHFINVKYYFFKLYSKSNLIRDFIPVHVPFQPAGKQNCMFDRVSGNLFCNAATGNDFKTNLTN